MDMNAAFPTQNITAADLGGRELSLMISHVAMETIGTDTKPVVHFQGMQQRLVLNKINSTTISEMYGTESDAWTGKQITLYPAWTDYQGKQVPCIRIEQQSALGGTLPPLTAPPPVPQPGGQAPQSAGPVPHNLPLDRIPVRVAGFAQAGTAAPQPARMTDEQAQTLTNEDLSDNIPF